MRLLLAHVLSWTSDKWFIIEAILQQLRVADFADWESWLRCETFIDRRPTTKEHTRLLVMCRAEFFLCRDGVIAIDGLTRCNAVGIALILHHCHFHTTLAMLIAKLTSCFGSATRYID